MTHRAEHTALRNLSPQKRLEAVTKSAGLSADEAHALSGPPALSVEVADGMIENVIGTFELPLGVATNFVVNGKDYLVPMAVEEPSVVAAASFMAKIVRTNGGFDAKATRPVMRAQVQILGLPDLQLAQTQLEAAKQEIIKSANSKDQLLINLGGGCMDIEVHKFPETPVGSMLVLHLLVDVRDAMGANTVNTMAEHVAPMIEAITGGQVRLRILSNLADLRMITASTTITPETLTTDTLDGAEVVTGIVEACALALVDPYRAATHNKGIMNGIDPVVLATGNDWRAIEAGAHAYAAQSGRYTSLTRWERTAQGNLRGEIHLPLALGLVGGATKTHPAAQAALKLLDVHSSNELAMLIASVGLAQNMAALRALATEGIQRGHMTLHARNIAITAGARGEQIAKVAVAMIDHDDINVNAAKTILDRF